MLDARAAGRALGQELLAMRQAKQAPAVDPVKQNAIQSQPVTVEVAAPVVNMPETVVNVSAPVVNMEAAVTNVAAPNVTVEPTVVNVEAAQIAVTVDMSGVEKAIAALASTMSSQAIQAAKRDEALIQGFENMADSNKAVERALLAPKTLIMGKDGKPIGVAPKV